MTVRVFYDGRDVLGIEYRRDQNYLAGNIPANRVGASWIVAIEDELRDRAGDLIEVEYLEVDNLEVKPKATWDVRKTDRDVSAEAIKLRDTPALVTLVDLVELVRRLYGFN